MKFVPSDLFTQLVSLAGCLLFVSSLFAIPEKPRGCRTYYCTDEDWEMGLKRFAPLTIRWPLHYDGSVIKDRSNGGNDDIDVVYTDHKGNSLRSSLSEFRTRPECPNNQYLNNGIKLPEGFVCKGDSEDRPTWEMTACSMVEASMEELTLNTDGGGCGKKLKFWVVIDWCNFVPNGNINAERNTDRYTLVKDFDTDEAFFAYSDEYGGVQADGYYTYTQVVKILDKDPPKMSICEDIVVEVYNGCDKDIILKNLVTDEGDCPGKKLEVTLEVYNDKGLLIYKKNQQVENATESSQNIGRLPIGEYQVYWKVKDACGNFAHCSKSLKLVDRAAPYLLCIQSLSTSLNHTDGLKIWAKDFVLKMEDQCAEDVTISFDPDEVMTQLSFDCTTGTGFHQLAVYATDSNGNQSTCSVELFISDRNICADSTMSIGGKISDRFGQAMTDVSVSIMSSDEEIAFESVNDLGQYFIKALPESKNKTYLQAELSDEKSQGLDAYDLIKLSQHIFEVEPFVDVLEYAAADINNDAKIDMEDYWSLAHLIFDIPFTIDQFQAWKFIDQKLYQSGQNRASKLTVPIQVSTNRNRYDLLALKSGDVDFSWDNESKAEARNAPVKFKLIEHEAYNELDMGSIRLNGLTLWIEGETVESFKANNSLLSNADIQYNTSPNGDLYVHINNRNSLNNHGSIILSKIAKVQSKYSFAWSQYDELTVYPISVETIELRIEMDKSPAVFPNPFEDCFTIQLGKGQVFTSDIQIVDQLGRMLISIKSVNSEYQKIDLSALFYHGVLLLKYELNNELSTKAIVKQ